MDPSSPVQIERRDLLKAAAVALCPAIPLTAAQAAAAALLTLVLENVVVEGPAGFFRRRDVS